MPEPRFPLIAKTFTGLEPALAAELSRLGATDCVIGRRMVSFSGDRELLYRTNLWCRTATRILKPIAAFDLDPAQTEASRALYAGLQTIAWDEHLAANGSLAIDPVVHGAALTNSLYAAQVAKDSIADWFRERSGRRPDVDRSEPDLRVNLHVDDRRVTVYLDASGHSLHKRGYRRETNEAPLNEVLAAGILCLSGWDARSPLVDFFCGSGTLPIEAALIARNIAPGSIRPNFGYQRWPDFDAPLHERLLAEARAAVRESPDAPIYGSDIDPRMVAAARDNAARAGIGAAVRWQVANFELLPPPAGAGVIVINPPYDARQRIADIAGFERRLGDTLKQRWGGYTAWILSGDLEAARHIGLRPAARIRLFNGPIECRLLKLPLFAPTRADESGPPESGPVESVPAEAAPGESAPSATATSTYPAHPSDIAAAADHDLATPDEPDAAFDEDDLSADHAPQSQGQRTAGSAQASLEMFRNRLRRMGRHWTRWARRQGITCYRLYDRDLPEVPLTIDRYEDRLQIVEHDRPHERTAIEHRLWLTELITAAAAELGVPADHVHAALRDAAANHAPRELVWCAAQEAGVQYAIRLGGHEVGLPLEERDLRKMIAAEIPGRRFLNLFGRCGAASVAAAAAGARETLTIESSPGLLAWSRRNLAQSGFAPPNHVVLEADPFAFLEREAANAAGRFDVALVAPPASFHRRADERSWNPRPEYLRLLAGVWPLIAPGGKLYFLSSVRRFRLNADDLAEEAPLSGASLREITRQVMPADFRESPSLRCWTLVRPAPAASS